MVLTRAQAKLLNINIEEANVSLLTEDNSPAGSLENLFDETRYSDALDNFSSLSSSDSDSSSISSVSEIKIMAFDRNHAFNIIPQLTGKNNLNCFIDQCKMVFEEFGESCEKSLLGIIKSKIPAKYWNDIRNCDDVNSLLDTLITTFGDDTPLSVIMTQLTSLKQSHAEDIKAYVAKCELILEKLGLLTENLLRSSVGEKKAEDSGYVEPVKIIYKRLLLDYFIKGIKDDKLRSVVMSNNSVSFEQAAQYAKTVEVVFRTHSDVRETSEKSRTKFVPTCFNCDQVGHIQKNCPKTRGNFKEKEKDKKRPFLKCNSCGKVGHSEESCFKKKSSKVNVLSSKNEESAQQIPPDILISELIKQLSLK